MSRVTNPFHDAISAIAKAGITTGCAASPPRYCPNDNVSRQAMAAFMHRGFGRVAAGEGSNVFVETGLETTVASFAITPGLPSGALAGAKGFVKLDGLIAIWQEDNTGCPCVYGTRSYLDGNPMQSNYFNTTLYQADQYATLPVTGVGGVTTSGTHTIDVTVYFLGGFTTNTQAYFTHANAVYIPFGSTGGNTLGLTLKPVKEPGAHPKTASK